MDHRSKPSLMSMIPRPSFGSASQPTFNPAPAYLGGIEVELVVDLDGRSERGGPGSEEGGREAVDGGESEGGEEEVHNVKRKEKEGFGKRGT